MRIGDVYSLVIELDKFTFVQKKPSSLEDGFQIFNRTVVYLLAISL